MKDTKRRMEGFSFYDLTGLEAHLERMAERGWLLDKIGSFTWRYRRIEPKQLTFSVSYFPRASMFDPGPSRDQETFYDFCAHTGWTLAAASAQMQVFYNERPDPIPIDTDPALEIEAIHQSAKKSFLLSQGLLLGVAVLNLIQYLWRLFDDPISILSSALGLFSLLCWPILILLIGVDFATYFLWRRRALKAAEQGEFLATKSHPVLQKISLAVVLAGLVWCLAYLRGGLLTVTVVMLACTFGTVFLVTQIRELLKRRKVSKGANRAATLGACVGLSVLVAVMLPAAVISVDGGGRADSDELPLTMSELPGQPDGEDVVQFQHFSQSPLLALLSTNQRLFPEETGAAGSRGMSYGVTVVKLPALYDICKNQLLHAYDQYYRHYSPIDPAPWGAAEAYQSAYEDTGLMDDYLLCYPDRIVAIDFDWEPTPEQMAMVAETLGRGPL